MDFEDFKLEPLSDGLGFHKKKVNLDSEVKKAGFVDEKLALRVPVATPLPIQPKPKQPTRTTRDTTDDDTVVIHKKDSRTATIAPFKDRSLKFSEFKKANPLGNETSHKPAPALTPKTEVGIRYREAISSHSFVSLVLDFFVVTGLFLTSSFVLSVVTGLNLDVLLAGFTNDPMTQVMMGILFFSISIFYLVLSRSVTFCTLGEWALDMKLGTERHRNSIFYPVRVFVRSFIILATGVIPITLISLVMRKDMLRSVLPLVKNLPGKS